MPDETPAPRRDLSQLQAYRMEDLPHLIPLSLSYLKALVARGEIYSIKVGSARIIPRWAVEQFLETPEALRTARQEPPGGPQSPGAEGRPGRR